MLVGRVFARAPDGLRTVERHVVVGGAATAGHPARQFDGPLAGDRLKVRLVLLVSEGNSTRKVVRGH